METGLVIMGLTIFWSVLALVYLILAIVTGRALYKLTQDLSELNERSPTGFILRKSGKAVGIESTLYNALKAILITEIIGFLLATAAAITSSIIFTPQ
jgi:hypothetical protein